MTKSELFKKAHALTKATIKAGDNYLATFALCLKAIYAESSESNIFAKIIAVGGKTWEKHGFKRIYMTVAQFNEVTGANFTLSDSKNKIFFDYVANAIMRSYKGKRPTVEVQF